MDLIKQDWYRGYIGSLETAADNNDIKFTESEWRDWIKKEAKEYYNSEEETDFDIDYIIEQLEEDGYVKESNN